MQENLFAPKSDWELPKMDELPFWNGARRVAIDIETCDPALKKTGIGTRRDGYIIGVSFVLDDDKPYYLPIRHQGGENLDPRAVIDYLTRMGKKFTGDVVGANLNYDLDYLWDLGITFPHVKWYRDIQIAAPLLDNEQRSYSLDNIAKRHGFAGKDQSLLEEAADIYKVNPKNEMYKLDPAYVGAYAEADVTLPMAIIQEQEKSLREENLWDIYNLESAVLPVILKMRRRGVRIDQEALGRVIDHTTDVEDRIYAYIKRKTGVSLTSADIWKADALVPILEHVGLELPLTEKTQKKSVKKEMLVGTNGTIAAAIGQARSMNKYRTTFAKSIVSHMVNGRINCTFRQIAAESETGNTMGVRYGRMSATNPNLQQQPARGKFSKMWRSIYVPEEGQTWACCDYSQQEPRWTTHFAAERGLKGAAAAAQAYHDDPNLDNHQFMADTTGLPRKDAKNIYLGLCYGQGGGKLCETLGLPWKWAVKVDGVQPKYFDDHAAALEFEAHRKDEGVRCRLYQQGGREGLKVIEKFDNRAPFIRQLANTLQKEVSNTGYVLTRGGRKLKFPQYNGRFTHTHKALNRVIQGTSADQTKKALVEIDKLGYTMMLQVHDEVDCSVDSRAEALEIGKIMTEAFPDTKVPFKVDVEMGPNWGDIK